MNDRLDERLRTAKPAEEHQDYTPKQTANRRAAARRWWNKHAAETIWTKPHKLRGKKRADQLFTTDRPDKPWLRWMDTEGRLHIEQELSAEQLIEKWQEAHEGKRNENEQIAARAEKTTHHQAPGRTNSKPDDQQHHPKRKDTSKCH
jgi:hypothetical protein